MSPRLVATVVALLSSVQALRRKRFLLLPPACRRRCASTHPINVRRRQIQSPCRSLDSCENALFSGIKFNVRLIS